MSECKYCGSACYSGAAHNARVEDGAKVAEQKDYRDQAIKDFCNHEDLNIGWVQPQLDHPGLSPTKYAVDQRTEVLQLRGENAELGTKLSDEEHAHGEAIGCRDRAEEALGDAYTSATGRPVEWSNLFGYDAAINEIAEAVRQLRSNYQGLLDDAVDMRRQLEAARRDALEEAASYIENDSEVLMTIIPGESFSAHRKRIWPILAGEIRVLAAQARARKA